MTISNQLDRLPAVQAKFTMAVNSYRQSGGFTMFKHAPVPVFGSRAI